MINISNEDQYGNAYYSQNNNSDLQIPTWSSKAIVFRKLNLLNEFKPIYSRAK